MTSHNPFPAECYFVGIGGVSMSALALLLQQRGVAVRGSDAVESEYTQRLVARGIPVHIGEDQEIYEDTVVYTGAVPPKNRQLSAAREAGKRLIPRADLLGQVASTFPHVLAVAGCHGKTSTTAMLAHIFSGARKRFTAHIGGEDKKFCNLHATGNEYFITEACEFQRSFFSLMGETAIILNTDRDHTDCYKCEEEVVQAYQKFASQFQNVIVSADDWNARKIPHALTFGRGSGDVIASNVYADRERYRFTVNEQGVAIVEIALRVTGEFHVSNALAAYCAARLAGLSPAQIKRGLESFSGVKRRFERVGRLNGVPVICDYAHHPQEIAATFQTARRICRGTVHVVFQPHTYTRTRDLMDDFVRVLKKAENPIIYQTYSAREQFLREGSAYVLASKIPEAGYVQTPEQLKKRLQREVKRGDLILILGAGDIYSAAQHILDERNI